MGDTFELSVLNTEGKVSIVGFEVLKVRLAQEMVAYSQIVVNAGNKTESKKTLATLRKKRKELEDRRIALKKEYDIPFNNFVEQEKELVAIIDKPIEDIDRQVKAIENAIDLEEQAVKAKKVGAIRSIFEGLAVPWAKFEDIYAENMLDLKLEDIKDQLETIIEAKRTILETLTDDEAALFIMNGMNFETAAAQFAEFDKARSKVKLFREENEMPF